MYTIFLFIFLKIANSTNHFELFLKTGLSPVKTCYNSIVRKGMNCLKDEKGVFDKAMKNKKSNMRLAAIIGSAVMIIGMSDLISDAMTINDNSAYITTANTAAASIESLEMLKGTTADRISLQQALDSAAKGAEESIRVTEQEITRAKEEEAARKKAEEKKKKEEEEKKKAEEEAARNALPTNAVVNTGWDQSGCLNTFSGVYYGPSGKETFYNLDMSGVINIMRGMGFSEDAYPYWVRDDGCKMLGNYIIVACNLDLRPRGTLVETSLGTGIVCDTSPVFVGDSATQVDVAVTW